MLRHAFPRLRDFLFVVVLAGALLSGTRMLNTDSDLGRHLTLGNYILSHAQIPAHNILSYTKAGEARPPYEWLAEAAFAVAYRLLTLDGVVLLSALVIAAAFTLVYVDALQRSAAPIIALLVTLWAATASSLHWVARPHLFSFVFLACWLAMLERARGGEKQPLWQFPALMLVWANTHGGFVFGFLAYAAYAAGWVIDFWRHCADWRLGRRLLAIGGTSLAASMLTPDLWGNWIATLNNRSSFVLARTVETMPLNLELYNSWPFLGLLLVSTALMVIRYRNVAPAHAILLLGLAGSAFAMARNVPLFAIAAAPLCTLWLAELVHRIAWWAKVEGALAKIDKGLRGFVWPVLAVITTCGLLLWHLETTGRTLFQWSPSIFPVQAASWLERNPQPGGMFNDINWGGYLTFRLWPEQRVFIDSQTDFYGEAFVREYANLLAAPDGWTNELSKYGVDTLILSPSTPLAVAAEDAGWHVAYQDTTAVVVVRR